MSFYFQEVLNVLLEIQWIKISLSECFSGLLSFTLILITSEVFYPSLITYTFKMLLTKDVSPQFQSSICS